MVEAETLVRLSGMEGVESLAIYSDKLIEILPPAFTSAASAKAAGVAEADRVLKGLIKIAQYRKIIKNKGVVVTLYLDGEEVAILGANAGIMRGHHIVEKSMVKLLKTRWGHANLDEAQVPAKILTHGEHFGEGSSLHNRMYWIWKNGIKTNVKSELQVL